jgi:hypothetical protein
VLGSFMGLDPRLVNLGVARVSLINPSDEGRVTALTRNRPHL